MLAAYGSGAAKIAYDRAARVLNVDVGGGTTKVSLIDKGRVVGVTALNIGARLIAFDASGRITRLEQSGKKFLDAIGCRLRMGDEIDAATLGGIAAKMAGVLFDALAGGKPPWSELMVMPPLAPPPEIDGLLFSGGVSEYIYGRETGRYGDLGALLGEELRAQAQKRDYTILDSSEGIRATVIGASQYSMQMSGETIFIPNPKTLPLHNLRVSPVRVTWDAPIAERAAKAIRNAMAATDSEVKGTPFALFFVSPPFLGYGAAQDLAAGIRRALAELAPEERPQMLVFEQNIGRVIGETLGKELSVPCVDEISLGEMDFIDVGTMVPGEDYVPVVIKSLAFGV